MKRNLLVGNGINIQFGGPAYGSEFILKRIKYNCRLGKYDSLFGGQITGKEIEIVFNGLVSIANRIIENQYGDLTEDPDTIEAIEDFKKRYTQKVSLPHEIMLEDWLLLVRVFFLMNSDLMQVSQGAIQGFEQLLLDCIYNNGKLQELHQNMNKDVKRFFNGYDKVFTLNYDNNIETLTHKNVYHLHGDFSVLSNSENPETVLGYIRRNEGKTVWQPDMKHCYCNALLNYSGRLKYKTAVANHKAILDSESYAEKYHSDSSFRKAVSVKNSLETQMIQTKIEHPELKMATEYYFYEFESIEGQLEIIGLSPNNDAHIFDAILNNPNITKVIFYYFGEKERTFIEENYPRELFECYSVQDLWKELKSERKVYSCNYNIPSAGREIIDALNVLSDDEISFGKIKDQINKIPQFQMIRLSKAVKEELRRRNPNHSSLSQVEFEQERAAICHIALQEGILPSVLYLVCVMNFNKLDDK